MRTALVVAAALTCTAAFAEELRVPERFATIQGAVAASVNGDVVLVAPGIYREAINLLGKKITLRGSGGAAVTILDGAMLDTTIVNASAGESLATIVQGFTFRNGRGKPTRTCSVDGRLGGAIFVVGSGISVKDCVFENNGVTDVPGGPDIRAGGAIFACQSDITVTGTRFEGNGAADGGAIDFRTSNRRATIERSSFATNRSATGGAINVYMELTGRVTVDQSAFTNNDAAHGAGISANIYGASIVIISSCELDGNHASHGGGIQVSTQDRSRMRITDTKFAESSASFGGGVNANAGGISTIEFFGCDFDRHEAGIGGGLFGVAAGGGTVTVSECRFFDNAARDVPNLGLYIDPCFTDGVKERGDGFLYGGGADLRTISGGSVKVTNSLFAGNSAPRGGGASATSCGGGSIDFINTTIADNNGGGGLYVRRAASGGATRVTNSILWNNSGGPIAGPANVTFSNVDRDPQFVNPAARDYRLSAGSACIDAGDNTALDASVAADLAGRLRRLDDPYTRDTGAGGVPLIDLGAYEFQPVVPRRRATGSR